MTGLETKEGEDRRGPPVVLLGGKKPAGQVLKRDRTGADI